MTRKVYWLSLMTLLGVMLSLHAQAAVNTSGVNVKWSYIGMTGPSHWGMLDPAFEVCDTGQAQSPINIGRTRVPSAYALTMNYHAAPMIIGDDMDTKINIGKSQTIITSDHGLQLNFHGKSKETVNFAGKEYELVQFHFHSPSETLWHKQSFPLEIHFVHQSKDGGAAVVAVFVKCGAANAALQDILKHIPEQSHQDYEIKDATINPGDLLPVNQRYFSYIGSLTTPPCTEGLQWIVLPEPITAAPEQISQIRQAAGGTNARPVQDMNARVLYYAMK